ncbi:hypothetical protein BST61_g9477 [Cercospora zeina]
MSTTKLKANDDGSRHTSASRSGTEHESPQASTVSTHHAEDSAGQSDSPRNAVCPLNVVALPQATSSVGFLDLPAELRNIIYEMCLLETRRINITRELKQPALLATCRQIRGETKMLWFWRNRFRYFVMSCDIRPLYWFHRLYGASLPAEVKVDIFAGGRRDWKALMHWCKLVFKYRRHRYMDDNPINGRHIMKAATYMARNSGAATWAECKRDLQLWRPMAAKSHRDWATDFRQSLTNGSNISHYNDCNEQNLNTLDQYNGRSGR